MNKLYGKFLEQPGFRKRVNQEMFIDRLDDAYKSGRQSCLAQGGTGVGKSLSYMISLVPKAKREGKRIVIVTSSKTLQDQVYKKDLPFFKEVSGLDINFSVLKGRSNYVCLKQIHNCSSVEHTNILKHNGDLDAAGIFDMRTRSTICASADNCIGQKKCDLRKTCTYFNIKEKIKNDDIVVINYHLLVAFLLFNPYANPFNVEETIFVCDEAHQFPDIVRGILGKKFSNSQLQQCKRSIDHLLNGKGNKRLFSDVKDIIIMLEQWLMKKGEEIANFYQDKSMEIYMTPKMINQFFDEDELIAYNETVGDVSMQLSILLDDDDSDKKKSRNINRIIQRFDTISDVLKYYITFFKNRDILELIYFTFNKKDILSHSMNFEVLEPGKFIQNMLEESPFILYTSATIYSNNKPDFIKNKLGIVDNYNAYIVHSDFDYKKQCKVTTYIHNYSWYKNPKEIMTVLKKKLKMLTQSDNGNILILFTSLANMGNMFDHMLGEDLNGYEILSQHMTPKEGILDTVRDSDDAYIIFGSNSFFEGIDIKLGAVVITNLPFTPPSDPYMIAQKILCDQKNQNFFNDVYIMDMIITLIQMAGRLIRNEESLGELIFLDDRIVTKGYGGKVQQSLPQICGNHKTYNV